jgi:two-component system nitrate/nitrite response regulator NarL
MFESQHRSNGDTITCIVADDHPMVRRGIIATLQDEDDFKVVAEASSGDMAVELVRLFAPRLVILDVNMPSCGLAASRIIKSEYPLIHTVMFSFRQDPEIIRASGEAGASGYIVKGTSGPEFVGALREILSARPFLSVDSSPSVRS